MSVSGTKHGSNRWTIARYGAAAVAATAGLAAATATEAAIIYTNPEPNVVATAGGGPASLNMDNAGADEYTFSIFVIAEVNFFEANAALSPAPGNSYAGHLGGVPGTKPLVNALGPNTPIPGSQGFLSGVGNFRDAFLFFDEGDWTGQTAFAGLQFLLGTNTHNGWAQFQVASDFSSITLFDYAYCDEPNGSINTGQTSGECNTPAGVPEPSSLLLLAAGAVAVEALRRVRRGKDAA